MGPQRQAKAVIFLAPHGRRAVLATLGALAAACAHREAAAAEAQGPVADRLVRLSLLLAEMVEAELRRVEAGLLAVAATLEAVPARPGQPAPLLPVAALDRAVRIAAASLGLVVAGLDLRLALIAQSDIPAGTPLPASPVAGLAADALDAGRPQVGLAGAGESGLAMAVPVIRPPADRPLAALVALLPADLLATRLARALEAEARADPVLSARLVVAAPGAPATTIAWARRGPSPAAAALPGTTEAVLEAASEDAEGPPLLVALRRLGQDPRCAVLVAAARPGAQAPAASPSSASSAAPAREPSLLPLLGAVGVGAAGLGGLLSRLLLRRAPRAPAPDLPTTAELEARQALAELRAICDTIPVGLALLDGANRVLSANHRLAGFAGLPAEILLGRSAGDVLPPPLAEAVELAQAQVLREGRPVVDVPVAVEAPGSLRHTRHLLLSCHPVRNASGRIEAVSVTIQDVTERARAEAGRELLVRELNHRVKNCLATVQTLAQQTMRHTGDDIVAFERKLGERIRALARAHDLLTAHEWSETELMAVARAALAPWLEDPRLEVAGGPEVLLRPAQAQALVLAFHELATNAAKHGALTRENGRVRLRWDQEPDGEVLLHWAESGGPRVAPVPVRRGFGTRLLEQALRHDLGAGARPEITFDPAGLRAAIRFRPPTLAPTPALA